MFEQFRVLRAAARLGEFTIAQLAEASGISEGTVQKTLKRRADVFIPTSGRAPSRGQRPAKIFRIRSEAIAMLLQEALDEAPPISTPSDATRNPEAAPLSLQAAKHTLLSMVPEASDEERGWLLAAVAEDLKATPSAWEDAALALHTLHNHVSTLLQLKAWFGRLDGALRENDHGEPPIVSLLKIRGLTEALVSGDARRGRDENPMLARQVASDLLTMPQRATILGASLTADAPRPPLPLWEARLATAAWGVTSDPLWSHVAGDVAAAELLASAVAPPARISKETNAEHAVRIITGLDIEHPHEHLLSAGRLVGWIRREPVLREDVNTLHVHGKLFDGPIAIHAWSHVNEHSAYTSETTLRVSLRNGTVRVRSGQGTTVGFLMAIDFDLVRRRIVGASISNGSLQGEEWLPYVALAFGDGEVLQRGQVPIQSGMPPPVPGPHTARRNGACIWPNPATLQVRVSTPIPLMAPASEEDYGISMRYEREQRIGDIWALDMQGAVGRIISAHAQQAESGSQLSIPFEQMEYDVERACFIHRGSGYNRGGYGPFGMEPFQIDAIQRRRTEDQPDWY